MTLETPEIVSEANYISPARKTKMPGKSKEDIALLFPEIAALRKELNFNSGVTCNSAPNSRCSSFKNRRRTKGLQVQITEPRRNSLPVSDNRLSLSYSDLRTTDKEPLQRVRSFKITPKGILNRGDSLRRKSNSSIASTGSSTRSDRAKSCERRQRIPSNNSEISACESACTTGSFQEQSYYRVLVVGDDGVGKTALTNQFMTSEYMGNMDDQTMSDVFGENDDVTVSVLLDGEESTLEFIKISESSWEGSLIRRNVDAYLVVYAVDNRTSYNEAIEVIQYLRQNQGIDRPIILVANKVDLVRKKLVKPEEAKKVAEENSCKFCEISVTINHNVDELLVGILRQIRLKLDPENFTMDTNATHLHIGSHQTESKKLRGAKGLFQKIFRKSQKLKNSCDNLFDL